MSIAKLKGRVTRLIFQHGSKINYFSVSSLSSGKEYSCICPFFCPVSIDYLITGLVEIEGNVATFKYQPIVIIPSNNLQRVFLKALRGTGFGAKKASLLESHLNQKEDHVDEYISDLSDKWMSYKSREEILSIFSGLLTETQTDKLLTWWYQKRNLMRLYLFGLTKRDIKRCHDSPIEIYHQLLENPFKVFPLTIEKCQYIAKFHLNRTFSEDEIIRAKLARVIYKNLIEKQWVGTPEDKVSLTNHKKNLVKEYDLHLKGNLLYLPYPRKVELSVSSYIHQLLQKESIKHPIPDLLYENKELKKEQQEAINLALNKNIGIISGPAGSGKTTLIKELIHQLNLVEIPYLVVSFTGKAIVRVKQVTGTTRAMTMHMAIRREIPGSFRHLIIDETSMVTTNLFYKFIERHQQDYKITLIGDNNQLPPIEWGFLFSQLLDKVPTIVLKENHRNIEGIKQNTDQLIEDSTVVFQNNKEFNIQFSNIDYIYDIVQQLHQDGASKDQIKVICPINKSLPELNETLSQYFNGDNETVFDTKKKKWTVGDRLMMLKNHYDAGIMNGEEGLVLSVNTEEIEVLFDYHLEPHKFSLEAKNYTEDVEDEIDPTWYDMEKIKLDTGILKLSFAITIHKSQGSEWDHVIVYMPSNYIEGFYSKNLIYTALTRGKKSIWCLGNINHLSRAANSPLAPRYESLM